MSIFSSSSKEPQKTPVTTTPTPAVSSTVNSQTELSRGAATAIANGTQVDGNLKVEGNIQIDGIVKGTITSKGKVIIGSNGIIEGDVLCQHAEISGKVKGKLKIADILFLKSSAKVDGDIQTGKLVMENGVQFNGNCSMGSVAAVGNTTTQSSASSPKPTPPPNPAMQGAGAKVGG